MRTASIENTDRRHLRTKMQTAVIDTDSLMKSVHNAKDGSLEVEVHN